MVPVRPPLSQRWNAVERKEAARRSRPRGMIFLMAPTLSVGDADRSVSVSIAGTREKLAGFHHFSSLSRGCGEKLWWQARTAPSQKPLNSRAQSPTCCSLPLERSNGPASRTTRYVGCTTTLPSSYGMSLVWCDQSTRGQCAEYFVQVALPLKCNVQCDRYAQPGCER
jgi:hypothetical protein